MRRGEGGRVPIPTKQETDEAYELGREIVACSGVRPGPIIHMNIAFHKAGISTVILDEDGARCLLAALKALFPRVAGVPASPATIRATGIEVQEGHMSA